MRKLAVVLLVSAFMFPMAVQAAPKTTGGPITASCDPCALYSTVTFTGSGYDPRGNYAAFVSRPDGATYGVGLAGNVSASGVLTFSFGNVQPTGVWFVTVSEGYGRTKWQPVASVSFAVA